MVKSTTSQIGLVYVEDILLASHDATELVQTFGRRIDITIGKIGFRFL